MKLSKLIVLFIFGGLNYVLAQQINPDLINLNCEAAKIEKVYVHTSSHSVAAGTNFLYKAYIQDGQYPNMSETSSIIYFDFINWDNQVVFHWKSNTKGNTSAGQVSIPDTISTGIYLFRAYSNWMLNKGYCYVFQKPVMIYNFRDENLKYIPKTVFKKEQSKTSSSSSSSKVNIETKLLNNNLQIQIFDPEQTLNASEILTLFGFLSGKKLISKRIRIQDLENLIHLKLDNTSGNLWLFLMDENNQVLAQYFTPVKLFDEPDFILENKETNYAPGKRVSLKFSCNNLSPEEKLSLSCTIREKDSILPFEKKYRMDNYLNYFSEFNASVWLNQKLKSEKELPTYVNSNNWIWNDYLTHRPVSCKYVKEKNNCLLRGHIRNSTTNELLKNKLILASYIDDKPVFDYCYTNAKGEFFFWLNEFYNNKKIYLLALENDSLLTNLEWQINAQTDSLQQLLENQIMKLSESQTAYLEQFYQLEMISQIYRTDEKINNINTSRSDTILRFIPNATIYPDDYINLDNFSEIADNILPGVFFKKKKNQWELKIYNKDYRDNLNVGGTIFLNGIPFYDHEYLANIPKESVEKIEIYKDNLFYGKINFNGILAVYTKNRMMPETSIQPGVWVIDNQVTKIDELSMFKNHQVVENFPNFERLLYWNSALSIDKPSFTIDFYTSELKTDYLMDIEGITSSGRPVSFQYEFSVK